MNDQPVPLEDLLAELPVAPRPDATQAMEPSGWAPPAGVQALPASPATPVRAPAQPAPAGSMYDLDADRRASAAPRRSGWRATARALGLRVDEMAPADVLRADIAVLATGFRRPMVVAVSNPKGGEGKTPVAVGLACAWGMNSAHSPAVVDFNPLGSLLSRISAVGSLTIDDMVESLDRLEAPYAARSDLQQFMRWQQDGRFAALTARQRSVRLADDGRVVLSEPTISRQAAQRVLALVTRQHSPAVVDTGNNDADPPFRAALERADALVVAVSLKAEGLRAATGLLQTLAETGLDDLRESAIIVPTWAPAKAGAGGPRPEAVKKYIAQWRNFGHEVIQLPPDPALDSSRSQTTSPILWSALAPATQSALVAIAAAVTRRFISVG